MGGPASCTVQLVGTRGNRDAVGATVTLRTKGRSLTQQVEGGGSYLSSPDRRLVFALAPDDESVRLEIQWPDGRMSTLPGLALGSSAIILDPRDPESAPGVAVQEKLR